MTKKSEESAYRTYCKARLVVSESADEVYADESVIEKKESKFDKFKKVMTLLIK